MGDGALQTNKSNEHFSQRLDPLLSENNATAMFTRVTCSLRSVRETVGVSTGEIVGVEVAQ